MIKSHAYIGLGSNLGTRYQFICQAIAQIKNTPGIISYEQSAIYESSAQLPSEEVLKNTHHPCFQKEQPDYLNAVLKIDCELTATQLFKHLQTIEIKLGRNAIREKNQPRTIDLDLLFFNDSQIKTDTLILPHPKLHTRWFVLKPLCDINPTIVHPTILKTVQMILDELDHY